MKSIGSYEFISRAVWTQCVWHKSDLIVILWLMNICWPLFPIIKLHVLCVRQSKTNLDFNRSAVRVFCVSAYLYVYSFVCVYFFDTQVLSSHKVGFSEVWVKLLRVSTQTWLWRPWTVERGTDVACGALGWAAGSVHARPRAGLKWLPVETPSQPGAQLLSKVMAIVKSSKKWWKVGSLQKCPHFPFCFHTFQQKS